MHSAGSIGILGADNGRSRGKRRSAAGGGYSEELSRKRRD